MLNVALGRGSANQDGKLIAMVAAGLDRKRVDKAIASGMRYLPSRNTVITPMMRGGFGDGFDTEVDEDWADIEGFAAS